MSFEIAYKMGQLRAKLDGDNAALMDEIVELAKKEESAPNGTVSIPFISTPQKDTNINDWTIRCAVPKENASVEASMAADNPETFGPRL